MEKRSLYAIVTVIVVILVIVSITAVLLYKPPKSVIPAPTLVGISSSTQLATVGSPIQFRAIVTGNVTTVLWNFGDGTTGAGLMVNHTYTEPGKYLVFANATGPSGYSNNLKNLWVITVSPSALSPALASEIAEPTLAFNTTVNPNAPIFNINSSIIFYTSYLQPPSAANWSMAYYLIKFGNGETNIKPVYYNISSGIFLSNEFNYSYNESGMYPVNLTIITYNQSLFLKDLVTSNNIEYLPIEYYNQIISSPNHLNTSYVSTIFVKLSSQTVNILKGPQNIPNPGVITVADISTPPYSLDPGIDYDWPGPMIFTNVYEQLICFNGSSTTNFIPVIAKEIPTISNGEISADGLNYTFYIRSGLKFSNGDTLNVWDVYTTYVRSLLFMMGSPATPGWLLGKDLLPDGGYAPGLFTNGTALYQNITKAITYDNATQSITFHLLQPDPAFFDILAYPGPNSILDYNWLVNHGAGINFTPSGFLSYTKYSSELNYNQYLKYNTMGSGPYMIQSYIPAQSIILIPNPYFTPIPGVMGFNKSPTDKVIIDYLKDAETAILMMQSGEADIVEGLPTYDYNLASTLQSQGKLDIITFPTLVPYFFAFNWNINVTLMKSVFGSQFNVPSDYFANLNVRKAFAYSFNYTNYIDYIIGNKIYHANFSSPYAGLLIQGIPDYIPLNKLQNVPYYNLTLARQFMMNSGFYNVSVNIPVIVWSGDTITYAAVGMWAKDLSAMDPNIKVTPIYLPFPQLFGYIVPNQNPMPIFEAAYSADYPYPSDELTMNYLPWGYYPIGLGWNSSNSEIQNLTNLILKGDSTINQTQAFIYWAQADQLAINLTLYVYTSQANEIWYFAPWINGMNYEENPMINGMGVIEFYYLSKGN